MGTIRLQPGDEDRVQRFLAAHSDSSLFLQSNLRAAGLVFEGKPLQGTWLAVEEQGRVVGVACHAWNDNLILQAPRDAGPLAVAAVAVSGRKVHGLLGPWDQVESARAALGLLGREAACDKPEALYALTLSALRQPTAAGEVRRVTLEDLDAVAAHRAAFLVEAVGERPGPGSLADSRAAIARTTDYFVLRVRGQPAASGCFNARLPDCVQLGGIFTPPDLRGRGYARQLVAGMLVQAQAEGVTRAVLFTAQDNVSARRAYESIGFELIGEYGLVLWNG